MFNKLPFCTVISLCTFLVGYGQTILYEGDLSIIGLDTPSEDFMFVTFVDLEAGTEIYFTDEEADGDYTIGIGEGTVVYVAPVGGVSAGSVISYTTNAADFSDTSDINFQLADSGDGLLAYQGSSVGNVSTFLHAVGENLSVIGTFPGGFSNYILLNSDDGEYFGVRSGETVATYAIEVNNISNWSTSGGGVSPFDLTNFSFEIEEINNCSELIISEYIEGSSNNKYIEIYNPTNSIITLTGTYSIQIFYNGSNSGTIINLIGSVNPFDVFVISDSSASLGIVADQLTSSLSFNGNDAVALINVTTLIDLIGVVGNDIDFAENIGLKRKINSQNPTVLFDELEWDTLAEDDVSNLGSHFGDCGYVCSDSKTTTWNGMAWSNGLPNMYTAAIINGNYNTSINNNFDACSLEIKENETLTIANSTYIEIQNNIEVKGDLIVETEGSFLQKNDIASFDIVDSGTASVNKTSAPINAWYEYTYWSSPVANATISNVLVDTPEDRRFWFKAQNWLDAFAETSNNNAAVAGQDDVDDNGDDWQYANANDVMIPGVGYAATYSSSKFTSSGQQYSYAFSGSFNNGIVTVPIYRNDAEINDINWNFIGNPYPSAIDVDAFFSENVYNAITNPSGVLDGAIYLWSQNTAPSSIVNGNEYYNFSQSDYAVINGVGTISAGGDGELPERFVPSCQGFFTSFSNEAQVVSLVSGEIFTGNVVFNNAMRVQNHNNQFFKPAKKNKSVENINRLWVNLTSDSGVFSQMLVGYVDGATDSYDTSFYDANRNLATGAYSQIYSTIKEGDYKLAIQGKSKGSLNLNEEILFGFDTTIEDNIMYELSIAKIEGYFLSDAAIYLEDSLLDLTHNLSESSYFFTSEKGEFIDRFKVKFSDEKVLGIETETPFNMLSILNLDNQNLEFSTLENLYIKNIEIIDLLGRKLYDFKGESNLISVDVTGFNSSIYFVRVQMSNLEVIQKKLLIK